MTPKVLKFIRPSNAGRRDGRGTYLFYLRLKFLAAWLAEVDYRSLWVHSVKMASEQAIEKSQRVNIGLEFIRRSKYTRKVWKTYAWTA
jgi:hypothetical protein